VLVVTVIVGFVLPASAGDQLPFKGRVDAVVTGATPAPDGLHLTVVGTGEATHLGRFARYERVVLHADRTFAGTLVFTAANGDRLSAKVAGAFISPTTAVGTYTFTGGTDRFRYASGSAAFVGVTPDGIHITLTFEGMIRF
jgi:hypothetical protein